MSDAAQQQMATPTECPLSARELQILDYVAQGYGDKQIGHQLDLSALTIKSHLARILPKLAARNRAQAVAFAMRAGWLQ